jgi:hypothetical protein
MELTEYVDVQINNSTVNKLGFVIVFNLIFLLVIMVILNYVIANIGLILKNISKIMLHNSVKCVH